MKIRAVLFLALMAAIQSCSSKEVTSSDAQKDLEDRYSKKVGESSKEDFVSEYGFPQWCKPEGAGTETCRFYKKTGTKWIGEKPDKKPFDQFDEVVADFDGQGKLRAFKVRSQR